MSRYGQVEFLMSGMRDDSGNVLAGGKVHTYDAGTSTEKETYQNPQGSATAANPIVLDAGGRANVFGNGSYKFRVYDSEDNFIVEFDNLFYGEYETSAILWGGTATNSGNDYAVTAVPAITELSTPQTLNFIPAANNTGASTLNVSGLGAIDIKTAAGADLSADDLEDGIIATVTYDGTNFVLSQASTVNGANIVAGTVDTAQLAATCVTQAKIGALAVDTNQIQTYAVTNAKLAADAVTNSKIADDSIDSEHYVDGSIDAVHLASNCVTNSKVNLSAGAWSPTWNADGSDALTGTSSGLYILLGDLFIFALEVTLTETESNVSYFTAALPAALSGSTLKLAAKGSFSENGDRVQVVLVGGGAGEVILYRDDDGMGVFMQVPATGGSSFQISGVGLVE